MMRYLNILLVTLTASFQLVSGELPRVYSDVDVVEHRLENGLRVLIQNNKLDDGEVFFRIFSHRGYAQENTLKEKVSAYVSFMALLESGLGHQGSSDQVSKILYEHSAELSLYVLPSAKGIEAKIPSEDFEELVEYITAVFKNHKISKTGYNTAISTISANVQDLSVKNKYNMIAKTYQVFFGESHFSAVTPADAIKHADMESAQAFVDKAFAEDEPFTFVVVGDISPEKVISTLNKYLPKKEYKESVHDQKPRSVDVTEPKIIAMNGSDNKEAVNSITYSIKMQPNGRELAIFETSLRVIENRLQEKLSKMVGRKGFRVSFEFPFYPEVSLSWVQIKFNVHEALKQPTLAAIQSHLEDLAANGPTQEELQTVVNSLKRGGQHLKNDNYFWLSLISDYALWDWDLNHIALRISQDKEITPQQIQGFLKNTLVLNTPVTIMMD